MPVSRKNTIRVVLDRLCNRSTGRKLLHGRRDEGRREDSRTVEKLAGLLADYRKPEDLMGGNGLLKQLTKRSLERALQAEWVFTSAMPGTGADANPAGETHTGKRRKTSSANCQSRCLATVTAHSSRRATLLLTCEWATHLNPSTPHLMLITSRASIRFFSK